MTADDDPITPVDVSGWVLCSCGYEHDSNVYLSCPKCGIGVLHPAPKPVPYPELGHVQEGTKAASGVDESLLQGSRRAFSDGPVGDAMTLPASVVERLARAMCAVELERERLGPLTDQRWQEMLWAWRSSEYPSDHSRVDRLMQQATAAAELLRIIAPNLNRRARL